MRFLGVSVLVRIWSGTAPQSIPATASGLLYRHALGEVAGFIDIAAEEYPAIIGKELERHDGQQRATASCVRGM